MPNLKFSQFQEQTDSANVQFVVGYNGTDNVRIAPGNLGGGYPFLIDTQSLYSGFVPSGLSGNPQGNTILGISAGNSLTTASNNTLIGDSAGKSITNNSTQNVIVGASAGEFKTTGSQSVLIGREAGKNSSGGVNVLIGYQAGLSSTASNTIAIGENAARVNQSSTHLSIGTSAGYSNTTGSGNTNVGYQAGAQITTGANNTNLGYQAGTNVTGNNNVLLGWKAGSDAGAWSNTIIIGYDGETSPAGQSNFIVLGNTSHTTLQIPGIQSGASNGDVLTFNSSAGKLELQTPSAGGATDLNGLSDCLVDTDSLYVGEVPSGLSGNPQGNTVLGIDAGSSLQGQVNNTLIGNDAGKNFGLNPFAGGVTYVGAFAGLNNTSGSGTTYIGYQAGQNQVGAANTAVGSQALGTSFSGSGTSNVAIGDRAGLGARGSRSTLLGYQTAYSSGTGLNDSILIGYRAGYGTNAANLVQIGSEAAKNNSAAGHISIGYQAGFSQTSGTTNTNIGYQAGYSNTTNNDRTTIGYQAGYFNTGASNTFIGRGAGYGVSGASTGEQNTAIGTYALNVARSGLYNTAIGWGAGMNMSTGQWNTLIGRTAGTAINNGEKNVVIGVNANVFGANAQNQIVIGQGATGTANNQITLGDANVTALRIPGLQSGASDGDVLTFASGTGLITLQAAGGGGASDLNGLSDVLIDTDSEYVGTVPSGLSGNPQGNTTLGIDGGNALTSGTNNTFIGNDAGKTTTTGTSNTTLGYNTLGYHNGNNNVAIGTNAMQGASFFSGTGADNVAIGYNAGSGSSPTAFSNSILIGKDAATSPAGYSNAIVLGNSSHNLLQIPGVTSGASNGDVLMYDTATFPFNNLKLYPSGTTPSDERDKKDIEDLPYGLAFVNSLQPRKYVWDNRVKTIETESFDEDGNPITITEEFVAKEKGTIGFGFIAQELQEVDNEVLQLVNDSNEDSLRINYSKLVPVLVKAIQELKEEIEILKSQNN